MWTSTVGLVNGKHRYLTAETFGFKISSNGQQLKRRQQWTIEPFPENTGPDGSISSAASVSSQAGGVGGPAPHAAAAASSAQQPAAAHMAGDPSDPTCAILTLAATAAAGAHGAHGGASSNASSGASSTAASGQGDETCGEEHENVAIRSHLNKYLAVDSFGNVTCDSDEKTENARFTITICSMSQGRSKEEHIFWAFKNVERGYYLGTTEDGMICCSAKMPKSRAELWHLHLLPARGASFFAIKSLGRKRFARVTTSPESGGESFLNNNEKQQQQQQQQQVQLDANISWGRETLFQFQYFESGGKYALLTSDQRLLTNEGKCISWSPAQQTALDGAAEEAKPGLPPAECLFTLEYHSGYLAFRDSFSQYLAAAGRSSVLRSRSIGVSRDELFVFEPAPVQVALRATFNGRWVSIKQGVDLSANQAEASSKHEIFQLTYHKQTQLWSIMTHDCNYWTAASQHQQQQQTGGAGANSISVCRPGDYEGLTRGQFRLVWSETDASFCMKYVDLGGQQPERWLAARKSGQLYLLLPQQGSQPAVGASQEPVRFVMRFQNRRLLNLRPVEGSGFVGLRSATSRQLECTKAAPEPIEIEYSDCCTEQLQQTGPARANGLLQARTTDGATGCGKPLLAGELNSPARVINVFNVRLNQTKMSPSVFDKLNNSGASRAAPAPAPHAAKLAACQALPEELVELDTQKEANFGIDANNNNNTKRANRKESAGAAGAWRAPRRPAWPPS